jgi:hypothetical protein
MCGLRREHSPRHGRRHAGEVLLEQPLRRHVEVLLNRSSAQRERSNVLRQALSRQGTHLDSRIGHCGHERPLQHRAHRRQQLQRPKLQCM